MGDGWEMNLRNTNSRVPRRLSCRPKFRVEVVKNRYSGVGLKLVEFGGERVDILPFLP